jgi:lipid-A-disaccharide synthase
VNVLSRIEAARVCIQAANEPEPMADALASLVADTPERRAVLAGLAEVRARLGTPGAADRVAGMASALAGASG